MGSGLNIGTIVDVAEIAVGAMTGQPEIAGMGLEDLVKNEASQAFGQALNGLGIQSPLSNLMQSAFDGALGNYQQAGQDLMQGLQNSGSGQSSGSYGGNSLDQAMNSLIQAFEQFLQQMQSQNNGNTNGGGGSGSGSDGTSGAGGGGATGGSGGTGGAGGTSGAGGSSGANSGDDFFIAMARALGQAAQNQADQVKQLSDKVAGDNPGQSGSTQSQQLMKDQTMLEGESSKLQFLMQAINTAMNAVGDALKTAATKM